MDPVFQKEAVEALEERGLDAQWLGAEEAKGLGENSTETLTLVLDLEGAGPAEKELIQHAQGNPFDEVVLVITEKEVEEALEGVRLGASLYLLKYVPPKILAEVVHDRMRIREKAIRLVAMEQEQEEITAVGSPVMENVLKIAEKAARTEATVLITGESGTGKELLARYIHQKSHRHDGPMVAINCAAVQESLMETELFGHVRGAFTGAHRDKAGLFEVAADGTVFLDEVGDLPLNLQARLLRFLQDHHVRRVGATSSKKIDVRVLAATHQDLSQMVKDKTFREDLFFRINVIPIHMPPLRDRKETIPALVKRFVTEAQRGGARRIRGVTPEAQDIFLSYEYPGNVRELENMVMHAVAMAEGDTIRLADLPPTIRDLSKSRFRLLPADSKEGSTKKLEEVERDHILKILEDCDGNRSEAARLLGISRSTLWRKLKDHGLEDLGTLAVEAPVP